MLPDFEKVIRLGVPGILTDVQRHRDKCSDAGKMPFYDAAVILCNLWRDYLALYQRKTREMSGDAALSTARRAELREISRILGVLTDRAPETFHEALQLYWVVFLLTGHDDAGRLDQLLYPFYKADMDAGRLTREQALTLLSDLWHKMETLISDLEFSRDMY